MDALTRRRANLLGFAACAAMMAFALYEEHVVGLEPCNMCILQRAAVVLVGALFLLAALHDPAQKALARAWGVLIAAGGAVTAALGARHVWMQHQPAGSLPTCGADFATMMDMMPVTEVIAKVLGGGGDCQRIDWTFLGLSMPGWVLVGGIGLALWGLWANLVARRADRTGIRPLRA